MSTRHFSRHVLPTILSAVLVVIVLATAGFGQSSPIFVNPTLVNGGSVISNYSPIPVQAVVSGDFNGDGKQDLLTLDDNGNTAGVGIMLGNGDGTFGAVSSVTTFSCTLEGGIVTGDFNHDGHLDFAVVSGTPGGDCNFNPGTLWIFLGNGAGGFTLKASYSELGGPANHDISGGLIAAELRKLRLFCRLPVAVISSERKRVEPAIASAMVTSRLSPGSEVRSTGASPQRMDTQPE